jgi:hypothetical protein
MPKKTNKKPTVTKVATVTKAPKVSPSVIELTSVPAKVANTVKPVEAPKVTPIIVQAKPAPVQAPKQPEAVVIVKAAEEKLPPIVVQTTPAPVQASKEPEPVALKRADKLQGSSIIGEPPTVEIPKIVPVSVELAPTQEFKAPRISQPIPEKDLQPPVVLFKEIQEQKSESLFTLDQALDLWMKAVPHVRTVTHAHRGFELAKIFKEVCDIPLIKAPLISQAEAKIHSFVLKQKARFIPETNSQNLSAARVIYNEFSPVIAPYIMKPLIVVFDNLTRGASCIEGTVSAIQCNYVNKLFDNKKIKITAAFSRFNRGNHASAENQAILVVEPIRFLTNFGQGITNSLGAKMSLQHKSLGQLVTVNELWGCPALSPTCNFIQYIPTIDACLKGATSLANFSTATYAAHNLSKSGIGNFINNAIASIVELSLPLLESKPWPKEGFENRARAYGALRQSFQKQSGKLTTKLIDYFSLGVKESTRGATAAAGPNLVALLLGLNYGLPDIPTTCPYSAPNPFEPICDFQDPLIYGYNNPVLNGTYNGWFLVGEKIGWNLLTYFGLSVGSKIVAPFLGGMAEGTIKFWLKRHESLIQNEVEKRLIKITEDYMFNKEETPRLNEPEVGALLEQGVGKSAEVLEIIAEVAQAFDDGLELAKDVSGVCKSVVNSLASFGAGVLTSVGIFKEPRKECQAESKQVQVVANSQAIRAKEISVQVKASVGAAIKDCNETIELAGGKTGHALNNSVQKIMASASELILFALPNVNYCNSVRSRDEDIRTVGWLVKYLDK